ARARFMASQPAALLSSASVSSSGIEMDPGVGLSFMEDMDMHFRSAIGARLTVDDLAQQIVCACAGSESRSIQAIAQRPSCRLGNPWNDSLNHERRGHHIVL